MGAQNVWREDFFLSFGVFPLCRQTTPLVQERRKKRRIPTAEVGTLTISRFLWLPFAKVGLFFCSANFFEEKFTARRFFLSLLSCRVTKNSS